MPGHEAPPAVMGRLDCVLMVGPKTARTRHGPSHGMFHVGCRHSYDSGRRSSAHEADPPRWSRSTFAFGPGDNQGPDHASDDTEGEGCDPDDEQVRGRVEGRRPKADHHRGDHSETAQRGHYPRNEYPRVAGWNRFARISFTVPAKFDFGPRCSGACFFGAALDAPGSPVRMHTRSLPPGRPTRHAGGARRHAQAVHA